MSYGAGACCFLHVAFCMWRPRGCGCCSTSAVVHASACDQSCSWCVCRHSDGKARWQSFQLSHLTLHVCSLLYLFDYFHTPHSYTLCCCLCVCTLKSGEMKPGTPEGALLTILGVYASYYNQQVTVADYTMQLLRNSLVGSTFCY